MDTAYSFSAGQSTVESKLEQKSSITVHYQGHRVSTPQPLEGKVTPFPTCFIPLKALSSSAAMNKTRGRERGEIPAGKAEKRCENPEETEEEEKVTEPQNLRMLGLEGTSGNHLV
ncbi:hypothetical protein BTVI_154798 [Pitangus sulphuratus]|nr:hypothetical protein BTVI_154798 [Pitangus sulphuratus]